MNAHTPARDGRSTDTRERALQVAEQLYTAGGYEHINLHVIAEQLGVSKAALFHHFKNKQDLFYATLLRMLARYHTMFAEAVEARGASVRERLRRIMLGLTQMEPFDMMRFAREEYSLLDPQQRVAVERAWRASLFDVVQRLLADGEQSGELRVVDLSLATYVFMHLCMLLPRAGNPIGPELARMSSASDSAATERAIDALLDLYLGGVGRPTGLTDSSNRL